MGGIMAEKFFVRNVSIALSKSLDYAILKFLRLMAFAFDHASGTSANIAGIDFTTWS
jgi:hypothetical protein